VANAKKTLEEWLNPKNFKELVVAKVLHAIKVAV
jgi:hypothetical protein